MRLYQRVLLLALLTAGLPASQLMAQGMRMSAEDRTKMLKDSLSLTTVQADSVLKIYKMADKERQEAMSSAGEDRDARMAAMRKVMEKTDSKIEGLLTPEQKTKYDAMKKQRAARMQQMQQQRKPD